MPPRRTAAAPTRDRVPLRTVNPLWSLFMASSSSIILGIDPDPDMASLVRNGHQQLVAVPRQGLDRRRDIQLPFLAGEEGLHHIHGDLNVHFGTPFPAFPHLDQQASLLLGDPDLVGAL